MRKWTAVQAFDIIHKVSANKVGDASEAQLNLMRQIFAHITVFGELRYSSNNLQVWEDRDCNFAIIDRILGEASVLYSGLRYVIEPVDEG